MNQIFLVIAFLMMIASSKNSGAQRNNDVAFDHSTSTVNLKGASPDKKKFKAKDKSVNASVLKDFIGSHKNFSEIKVTTVNIKAVRHFILSYKNISDAKWYKTEGGYLAYFRSKGIDTRIVYDDKGRWFYNVLTYTEANLTFNIRDMVKSKYYDNDIFIVYQYEFDNKTLYLIRMHDQQSNIVTLKVCDGEIEDITRGEKN